MMWLRDALAAQFYRPSGIADVQIDGLGKLRFALHSRRDRWISEPIRRGDIFERHIVALLQASLRPNETLLDLGGNIGWFAVIGSHLVGSGGQVHTFEPDPFNLRLLRLNLRLNRCRNVVVHAVAAGAEQGSATLYRSPDNQGDHQLATLADRPDQVRVRVDTIDRIMQSMIRPVSWIKIDTQGSEVAILTGMRRVLTQTPMPRLVLEFWPHGLERCGSSSNALLQILGQLDAAMWLLLHDGTTEHVDVCRLTDLARTTYAPAAGAHADLVVIPPDDVTTRSFLEKHARR